MTIKQVLIGAVVGSSIVSNTVHLMRQSADFQAQPLVAAAHTRKIASLPKHHYQARHTKDSAPVLSSSKLYGK